MIREAAAREYPARHFIFREFSMKQFVTGAALLALLAGAVPAQAKPPKASKAQKTQVQMVQDVPRCTRKLGTISIAVGDDPYGWTQYNLAPPAKLLKVLVQRSGCFNLVDRGTGLNAARAGRLRGCDAAPRMKPCCSAFPPSSAKP